MVKIIKVGEPTKEKVVSEPTYKYTIEVYMDSLEDLDEYDPDYLNHIDTLDILKWIAKTRLHGGSNLAIDYLIKYLISRIE
jgi:hypothetical protein